MQIIYEKPAAYRHMLAAYQSTHSQELPQSLASSGGRGTNYVPSKQEQQQPSSEIQPPSTYSVFKPQTLIRYNRNVNAYQRLSDTSSSNNQGQKHPHITMNSHDLDKQQQQKHQQRHHHPSQQQQLTVNQNNKLLNLKLTDDDGGGSGGGTRMAESSITFHSASSQSTTQESAPASSSQTPSSSSLSPTQTSTPSLSSSASTLMRSPKLVLAETYNIGHDDTGGDGAGLTAPTPTTTTADSDAVAMASSPLANSAMENPAISAAMLGSNLIDSLDFVSASGGGLGETAGASGVDIGFGGDSGGGHFDYTYQAPKEPSLPTSAAAAASPAAQFTMAAINQQHLSPANSSTMALYHLLNLIEQQSASQQVAPHLSQASISLPFQNSKLSSAYHSSASLSSPVRPPPLVRTISANGLSNFDNYNNYYYNTIGNGSSAPAPSKALFTSSAYYNRSHQHPFAASQYTSSSSAPNYWPRRRTNQMHWRQEHQPQLTDVNHLGGGGDGGGVNGFSASTDKRHQAHHHNSNNHQSPQSLFVDNLIEVQPAALKMIKTPSSSSAYLNMPPSAPQMSSGSRKNSSNQSHYYNNNHPHHHSHHHQHLHHSNQYQLDRGGAGSEAGGANFGALGGGGGGGGGGHSGSQHNFNNGSSSSSLASSNNLNNNNNNHFNSLLNNDAIGFGNKQPQPLSPSSSLQPSPPSASAQLQQAQSLNSNGNGNGNGNLSEKLNGALTSSSLSNSKVPHDADSEMIATNAPRCDKFTPDICVDDFEYPEQAIIDEIQKKRDVFELMYSEVKDNEPLVDGIPRDVEESYNYDYYYYGKANLSQAASQASSSQSALFPSSSSLGSLSGSLGASGPSDNAPGASLGPPQSPFASSQASGAAAANKHHFHRSSGVASDLAPPPLDSGLSLAARASSASSSAVDRMAALIGASAQATSPVASAQSPPTTGYICPSEVMYGKPKLAKNKKGLWKVIVNAGEFTQTVRLEKCLFPNKKCNYVSAQSYESRCAQVHSYHRLLVFEKGRGFYIDTFRLPTGCNCYVSKRPFVSSAGSSSSSTSSSSSSSSPANNRRDSNANASYQDSTSGGGSSSSRDDNRNGDNGSSRYGAGSGYNGNGNGNGPMTSARLPSLIGDSSPSSSYGGAGSGNVGHNQAPSDSRGPSSESMLSQTLWSILSGGGGGGGGGGNHGSSLPASNGYNSNSNNHNALYGGEENGARSYHQANHEPASTDNVGGGGGADNYYQQQASSQTDGGQFDQQQQARPGAQREAYQSQSLILEHLSQNPALAANISNSVLRQLIDVGQISAGGSSPSPSSIGRSGLHYSNNNHQTTTPHQIHRQQQPQRQAQQQLRQQFDHNYNGNQHY